MTTTLSDIDDAATKRVDDAEDTEDEMQASDSEDAASACAEAAPLQDLVEDEPPQTSSPEDEGGDDPHPRGAWILVSSNGKKHVAKVLEDMCMSKERKGGKGKTWYVKVHLYSKGEAKSLVKLQRKCILGVLKADQDGQPIDPSESEGESEGESSAEEAPSPPPQPKAQSKKKAAAKKKDDHPRSPIDKKGKAPKKSKKAEVDHQKACADAREWAIQQLSLHKFKDADTLSTMAKPDLFPEGTNDTQLKGFKKSLECADGVTFRGCVMGYANSVATNGMGRNLFASLLILMFTTKTAQSYSDLKSLKKYIKDEAWYNVQGHLSDDILKLDFTNKDQLQYVKSLYRCLNTHLSPDLAKFAPGVEVTQEMQKALQDAEIE